MLPLIYFPRVTHHSNIKWILKRTIKCLIRKGKSLNRSILTLKICRYIRCTSFLFSPHLKHLLHNIGSLFIYLNSSSNYFSILNFCDILVSKRSLIDTLPFLYTSNHSCFYISGTSIIIKFCHSKIQKKHEELTRLLSKILLRGCINALNISLFQ